MTEILGTYKENELTPFPFEVAYACMRWALQTFIQGPIPNDVLSLALAKTALETGRWTKIHDYNWGNQKYLSSMAGMFTCFGCDEIIGGHRVWFDPTTPCDPNDPLGMPNTKFSNCTVPPGNPQTRFRAFANEYDGVDQYVDLIANSKRYSASWKVLLTGNATAWVHALKMAGYFTADEATYAKGVVSLQKEFLSKINKMPVTESLSVADCHGICQTIVPQFQLADLLAA